MTIKQISIFIENKSGTLLKVLNVLKEANIQIIASTISDTVEYGIYRIICDNPTKAISLLKEHGISAISNDVFAIELDDTPGQAASAIQYFADAGINISYMYSFLVAGKGILILRTNDTEKTQEIIALKKLKTYDLA
ncbi:MAG: amino acid-binding protein [Bacteroidaceae bacterium]|nr:amino acid-binding protein [Bacteroidaceae bacterium]MBP5522995.1 amino acid-binding protein [Bacteroidaceae bacterium]